MKYYSKHFSLEAYALCVFVFERNHSRHWMVIYYLTKVLHSLTQTSETEMESKFVFNATSAVLRLECSLDCLSAPTL